MSPKFHLSLPKTIPFIILLILAFTYRDVLRSIVLIPLAYLIFFFQLISSSIGQQALWISFVVLAIIVGAVSLAGRSKKPPAETPEEQKYPSRLKTWGEAVSRKERSAYFKWNLAQDLSNLLVEAIAYHNGISNGQALRKIHAGQLDLPPDILSYLQTSQKPFNQTGLANFDHGNRFGRIGKAIFQTQRSMQQTRSPLDLEPEKVIRYIENYLGIDAQIWDQ